MNIIIPMAGRGTRIRPHSLTTPKPLIPVAGKPIVERLVEDIVSLSEEKVESIGFIIGDFGKEVEENLLKIAKRLGAKGHIFYQTEKLGTAHAILCAKELLDGKVIVAFADTLFKGKDKIKEEQDGMIFVQKVEDPSAYGVVKLAEDNHITDFVEKPETFVSDLAIIGIYYFKDGAFLRSEMEYLVDNDLKEKGEYQLTNAMENMKQKGSKFYPGEVEEWLDCGNKDAAVYTNQRVLEFIKDTDLVDETAQLNHSIIIPPCFIGKNVVIDKSVIGPHVSIGENSIVKSCIIDNSIVQLNTEIENKVITNSMLGNFVKYKGSAEDLSIGDYCEYKG